MDVVAYFFEYLVDTLRHVLATLLELLLKMLSHPLAISLMGGVGVGTVLWLGRTLATPYISFVEYRRGRWQFSGYLYTARVEVRRRRGLNWLMGKGIAKNCAGRISLDPSLLGVDPIDTHSVWAIGPSNPRVKDIHDYDDLWLFGKTVNGNTVIFFSAHWGQLGDPSTYAEVHRSLVEVEDKELTITISSESAKEWQIKTTPEEIIRRARA